MLPLSCACGSVTGALDPTGGVRVTCHCDDCQAWARWLGRDDVLDTHGGTEVVQTWPARVRLEGGEVALARLSDRGMLRWYAPCCRTPLANGLPGARWPFLGLVTRWIADRGALDATFGAPVGTQGRFAPGGCPPGVAPSATPGVILRSVSLLARGALAGAHVPHPFRRDGALTALPRVLTAEERARLAPDAPPSA